MYQCLIISVHPAHNGLDEHGVMLHIKHVGFGLFKAHPDLILKKALE